ncbi:MarR family winged helix-turn-helix transcriptional regulator [Streptomyces sp. NPDC007172]|uniref:MarR family winged helix-turn-helix transcriptional regulator n=1 Tax=Streptomyces sp. NPDC007172 TaxID=3364776 RepID=UPI00367F1945
MAQADPGRRFAVDPEDMVGMLNQLQQAGLVLRTPDPADRRKNAVTVTPKGTAVLARCGSLAASANAEPLAPLTPDEQAQLMPAHSHPRGAGTSRFECPTRPHGVFHALRESPELSQAAGPAVGPRLKMPGRELPIAQRAAPRHAARNGRHGRRSDAPRRRRTGFVSANASCGPARPDRVPHSLRSGTPLPRRASGSRPGRLPEFRNRASR